MSYYTNGDIVQSKKNGLLYVCFQSHLFQIHDNTKETRATNYRYTDFNKVGDLRNVGARIAQRSM